MKKSEMSVLWKENVQPHLEEGEKERNLKKGIVVQAVRYVRVPWSKRPYKKTGVYFFVSEEGAEACIEWFVKRGGVIELFSYKILHNHIHPLDPDLSNICPC